MTDEEPMPPRDLVRRRARIAGIVVLLALCAGTARTIWADVQNGHKVDQVTNDNAKQYVDVVMPTVPKGEGSVVLPATLHGFVESPIYARTSGYVVHWYADIGAKVQKGQLLAVLDTPEVDQELVQTSAQRQQTASALSLAKTSADRWQQLRQRDAVSQQELDDRQGSYKQAVANDAAAAANVARLRQLESFKRIVAPFTGVVTQRNVDVGDLIASGNGGAAMFSLAQSDPLRVYVSVPQSYTAHVTLGQQVTIKQAEFANTTFNGTITHIAGGIDIPTRSLQVEVTLPNPRGTLLPGAYVQLSLPTSESGRLTVPGNALLYRAEGPAVAVVERDGRVKLHPIVIARDMGATLELENGVTRSDRVIVNPSDSIDNGDRVTVTPPDAKKKGDSAGTDGKSASSSSASGAHA